MGIRNYAYYLPWSSISLITVNDRNGHRRGYIVSPVCERYRLSKAALTTETKQHKTIPKQIQNNVLFQALLHAKQNTETIPKRFGIVLELFQSRFRLINIFIHMSKNYANPKTVSEVSANHQRPHTHYIILIID